MEIINSIGRRKSSVARLFLKSGNGKITINGKDIKVFFPQDYIRQIVMDPMKVSGAEIDFDLNINVEGGGFKGQSEAIRLAISRALVKVNEDYKKPLKEKKYLTRDARVVERKKPGKPKARKSFQFSKR
ncbi:MAG: 30S ribosomal protein S9 [Saprospiraceae bacterium]|jgi:small subunit ribosomal protein S9|nr:30S ribosomal protein S9 [Saprospiraceae bacterium]